MYESILGLHSYWAYAVLVFLLIAVLNAFLGMASKRSFLPKDRQISLIALIFSHIQFLFGVMLLFTSPYFETAKQAGMGAVMKDSNLRLFIVEHPLINIIAITLITIGWSKHKKQAADNGKFKAIGWLYLIGLILLLSRIPYSQWFN